jgi:hypothetical protein
MLNLQIIILMKYLMNSVDLSNFLMIIGIINLKRNKNGPKKYQNI